MASDATKIWNSITGKKRYWRYVDNKERELQNAWNSTAYKDYYINFREDAIALANVRFGGTLYVMFKGKFDFAKFGAIFTYIFVIAEYVMLFAGMGVNFLLKQLTGDAYAPLYYKFQAWRAKKGYGGIFSYILKNHNERIKENFETQMANFKQSSIAFKQKRDLESKQLSDNIICTQYDIYANNRIYNQGKAGDLATFNPAKAYDANKGILGQNRASADDIYSDSIMNRSHATLGGNAGYMQTMLGVPFPLADKGIDYESFIDTYQKNMEFELNRMNEAFSKIIELGFGAGNDASAIYKDCFTKYVEKHKIRADSAKFLQEFQSYRNAAPHAFEYHIRYRDEEAQQESEILSFYNNIMTWNDEESIKERESWSMEKLARAVIDTRLTMIEIMSEFVGGSYYRWWRIPDGYAFGSYTEEKTSDWDDFIVKFEAFDSESYVEATKGGGLTALKAEALKFEAIFSEFLVFMNEPQKKYGSTYIVESGGSKTGNYKVKRDTGHIYDILGGSYSRKRRRMHYKYKYISCVDIEQSVFCEICHAMSQNRLTDSRYEAWIAE